MLIRTITLAFVPILCTLSSFQLSALAAKSPDPPSEITDAAFLKQPQWTTSSRLLKLGERIQYRLYLPAGIDPGTLEVFPRFLESATVGDAFDPHNGEKPWLDQQTGERIEVRFQNGAALVSYTPQKPGNYLARWRVNGETLFRYFSVVEDDWAVVVFSTYYALTPHPALHGTGIPLDHRPPALPNMEYERTYETADKNVDEVLFTAHRKYGEAVIQLFPSTFGKTTEERLAMYRPLLEANRKKYPDPTSARSARVLWKFDDQGPHRYQPVLEQLGINDHSGMWVGNATPWMGMPEFPFYTSAQDDRLPDQTGTSRVMAHQWDFTTSWHFLGPVSWHSQASRGDFERTRHCLEEGIREYENLAQLSGHPAFVMGPLYDGIDYYSHPRTVEAHTWATSEQREAFVKKYLQYFAFEATRKHRLAFARSVDVADYYRRHFTKTPPTIFSCTTDHVHYDMWWLPSWSGMDESSFIQEFIPWMTRVSMLKKVQKYKDPLSYEFLLIEDDRRSVRFERNSPNPIWWYDYTEGKLDANGWLARKEFPDVLVADAYKGRAGDDAGITDPLIITSQDAMPSWRQSVAGDWIKLKMEVLPSQSVGGAPAPETVKGYPVCLWNIPESFAADPDPDRIESNATNAIVAKNTAGEYHLVLTFDLQPNAELNVRIKPIR